MHLKHLSSPAATNCACFVQLKYLYHILLPGEFERRFFQSTSAYNVQLGVFVICLYILQLCIIATSYSAVFVAGMVRITLIVRKGGSNMIRTWFKVVFFKSAFCCGLNYFCCSTTKKDPIVVPIDFFGDKNPSDIA